MSTRYTKETHLTDITARQEDPSGSWMPLHLRQDPMIDRGNGVCVALRDSAIVRDQGGAGLETVASSGGMMSHRAGKESGKRKGSGRREERQREEGE